MSRARGPWATNLGLEHHYITALVGNGETVYAGAEGDEIYRLNKGLVATYPRKGDGWQYVL